MLNSFKFDSSKHAFTAFKYAFFISLFSLFLAIPAFFAVSFAGDSDKRKITPVVIVAVEYEVARAVLICPVCGFEVVTTRLDYKRPCPECGEFLDVIEVDY